MTPRTILILTLRILGIWFFLNAIAGAFYAATASYQYAGKLASYPELSFGLRSGVEICRVGLRPTSVSAVAAAVLLLCAPRIASLYYRSDVYPNTGTAASGVTLTDVYRIVMQAFGVFICLRAISPLALAIASLGDIGGSPQLVPKQLATTLEAILYIAIGGVLIGGAGVLARWATALPSDLARRRDSAPIARQRRVVRFTHPTAASMPGSGGQLPKKPLFRQTAHFATMGVAER